MRPCFFGALALVAACGGANAVDVFGSSDSGAGSADASTSSDGSSSSDGASTGDGGPKADAANPNPGNPDPGVVACGNDQCARTGALREVCCYTTNGATCQAEALTNACDGSRLLCDEKADCENGVCCIESAGGGRFVTRCLPTCTTDALRFQVCKTSAECQSGSCKAYSCGSNMPPLKFCQRPPDCQ